MHVVEALGEAILQAAMRFATVRGRRGVTAVMRALPDSEDLRSLKAGRDRARRVDRSGELATPAQSPGIPHGTPVTGRVSSGFGMRLHPIAKVWKQHQGIDIAAPVGTPVSSMADGTVTYAGAHSNGYGPNMVMIDHGNGYVTRYAHLSQVAVVRGEKVRSGQVVGLSGSAGSGPHLHLEVIVRGEATNPSNFLGRQASGRVTLGTLLAVSLVGLVLIGSWVPSPRHDLVSKAELGSVTHSELVRVVDPAVREQLVCPSQDLLQRALLPHVRTVDPNLLLRCKEEHTALAVKVDVAGIWTVDRSLSRTRVSATNWPLQTLQSNPGLRLQRRTLSEILDPTNELNAPGVNEPLRTSRLGRLVHSRTHRNFAGKNPRTLGRAQRLSGNRPLGNAAEKHQQRENSHRPFDDHVRLTVPRALLGGLVFVVAICLSSFGMSRLVEGQPYLAAPLVLVSVVVAHVALGILLFGHPLGWARAAGFLPQL